MFTKSQISKYIKYHNHASKLVTIMELRDIPDKSIVWYPNHSDDFGGCLTGRALKQYIEDQYGDKHFQPEVLSSKLKELIINDIEELAPNCPTLQFINSFGSSTPIMEVCSETLEDYDNKRRKYYPQSLQELIGFIKSAVDKGYVFYSVPYDGIGKKENVRYFWCFD